MGASDYTFAGKLIYVCGRSASAANAESFSLKGRLIADLSRSCFVRTHTCPVDDMIDAYCAIASSHTFVFTFNAFTIFDADCLNQLGVAMLYNIPIITVREESFELPKPMPLRFYETKFIDRRAKKDSNDGPSTLAGVLTLCFENAIVCKKSFYSTFLGDVLRSLPSLGVDGNGNSEQSTSEEESNTVTSEMRSSAFVRTGVASSRLSKRGARTVAPNTATQKQRGLENIYGAEQKLLNRQSLINRIAYKKLDLNFTTGSTAFNHQFRKPQQKTNGRQAFRSHQGVGSARKKENRPVYEQDSPRAKPQPEPPKAKSVLTTRSSPPERVNTLIEMSKTTSISAQELTVDIMQSDMGLKVPVIGPKGQKLRRYSSLPVVPTHYLVASESEHGSPQVMSFPPPSSNYHLSPNSESPMFFSGDELDFDPIHISRTCTPVDPLYSTSRSDSPEDSSR